MTLFTVYVFGQNWDQVVKDVTSATVSEGVLMIEKSKVSGLYQAYTFVLANVRYFQTVEQIENVH